VEGIRPLALPTPFSSATGLARISPAPFRHFSDDCCLDGARSPLHEPHDKNLGAVRLRLPGL
jgi:hypothetical protein